MGVSFLFAALFKNVDKVVQFIIICLGCLYKTSNRSLFLLIKHQLFHDTDIIKVLVAVILPQ